LQIISDFRVHFRGEKSFLFVFLVLCNILSSASFNMYSPVCLITNEMLFMTTSCSCWRWSAQNSNRHFTPSLPIYISLVSFLFLPIMLFFLFCLSKFVFLCVFFHFLFFSLFIHKMKLKCWESDDSLNWKILLPNARRR